MSSFKCISCKKSAFTLVEVVLAIGIVSFSLMVLVGTLPTGLKSVTDSMGDSARANTIQQIRAELQQVSFGTNTSDNINSLSQQSRYFSNEGLLLPDANGAYYKAAFQTTNAVIPSANPSPVYFQSSSAQTIQVTLSYPLYAPAENQQKSTLYLFVAKQKTY